MISLLCLDSNKVGTRANYESSGDPSAWRARGLGIEGGGGG
jgi:hypothetical protein